MSLRNLARAGATASDGLYMVPDDGDSADLAIVAFGTLLGLVGLTSRVPRKPGPAPLRRSAAPADPPVAEPAPTPTA